MRPWALRLPDPVDRKPDARWWEAPPVHVALIGMMAVGKTTVGRALAAEIGARFVDTDEVIEGDTGHTPRELWEEGGEAAYRPLERAAVVGALASTEPVVLATPGGVAVDEHMADAVRAADVTTVYLRATRETLVARVGDEPHHRPLLGDDPPAAIARLLRERDGRYEALADHVVDVDDRTPDEVLAAVRAALGRATPSGLP
jgi:shikimate kinase